MPAARGGNGETQISEEEDKVQNGAENAEKPAGKNISHTAKKTEIEQEIASQRVNIEHCLQYYVHLSEKNPHVNHSGIAVNNDDDSLVSDLDCPSIDVVEAEETKEQKGRKQATRGGKKKLAEIEEGKDEDTASHNSLEFDKESPLPHKLS